MTTLPPCGGPGSFFPSRRQGNRLPAAYHQLPLAELVRDLAGWTVPAGRPARPGQPGGRGRA